MCHCYLQMLPRLTLNNEAKINLLQGAWRYIKLMNVLNMHNINNLQK